MSSPVVVLLRHRFRLALIALGFAAQFAALPAWGGGGVRVHTAESWAECEAIVQQQPSGTVVFTDIDKTLVRFLRVMGTPLGLIKILETYDREGQPAQQARERALRDWYGLFDVYRKLQAPIEPGQSRAVASIAERAALFGLTARGTRLAKTTHGVLAQLGIRLSGSQLAGVKPGVRVDLGHGCSLRDGVVYTGWVENLDVPGASDAQNKANGVDGLLGLLARNGTAIAQRVVIIDDLASNLRDIGRRMEGHRPPVLIHYTGARKRGRSALAGCSMEELGQVVEVQLQHARWRRRIPTDRKALEQVRARRLASPAPH